MKLIKENGKGKTFQANGFKILYRIKGSISGDNSINVRESLYLVSGSAELTLKDKTWVVDAPAHFVFPEKTHHKIVALTDICIIMDENN